MEVSNQERFQRYESKRSLEDNQEIKDTFWYK
ncbi:hypothetical protein ACHAXS_001185, partial [Conticribra weissflogii]